MPPLEALKAGSYCWVQVDQLKRPAVVISSRASTEGGSSSGSVLQYYVHFEGSDKRLDRWVDGEIILPRVMEAALHVEQAADLKEASHAPSAVSLGKRKRVESASAMEKDVSPAPSQESLSRNASPAPASKHHRLSGTAFKSSLRNIEKVYFGAYVIKTWYYSPYPLEEDDHHDVSLDKTKASAAAKSGRASGTGKGRWPEGSKASRERERLRKEREIQPQAAAVAAEAAAKDSPSGENSIIAAGNVTVPPPPIQLSAASLPASKEVTYRPAAPDGALISSFAHSPAARSAQTRDLWVCEGCFKYMRTYGGWNAHKKECKNVHPPGRKVYQRGAHIIWEVDGAMAKLYCQNLSLFGKLFIDHKTIYFDVEPFTFYVLTDATSQFDHALGFFSKEKVSYDHYNLACIITFPPYQRKGFGTLMIEFSYFLSSLADSPGTPERPLSDLGLKGYLAYWSSVVLRTLALALDIPDSSPPVPAPAPSAASDQRLSAAAAAGSPLSADKKAAAVRKVRTILAEGSAQNDANGKRHNGLQEDQDTTSILLKRPARGWAGEVVRVQRGSTNTNGTGIEISTHHTPLEAGTNHREENPLTLETTLERLAAACQMRVEDTAFALSECGLLGNTISKRKDQAEESNLADKDRQTPTPPQRVIQGSTTTVPILLLKQAVEEAIVQRKVKRKVLDEAYVLI